MSGGPTFKSLATYTADGAFVSHDQGSVVTDPLFPHVFSASHGVWVHQGNRTFTATFLQLISDLNGALVRQHRAGNPDPEQVEGRLSSCVDGIHRPRGKPDRLLRRNQ